MRHSIPPLSVIATLAALSFSAAQAETHLVIAREHRFVPAEISVRVGDRVRWENQEKRQYHSVYFESLHDAQGDYFFPGESRERVFDQPGTYHYICEPHWQTHGMKGVVQVVE